MLFNQLLNLFLRRLRQQPTQMLEHPLKRLLGRSPSPFGEGVRGLGLTHLAT